MKAALKIAAVVVMLLIVAAIALPFLVNVNTFRPQIESSVSAALGRAVKVGNLSLSVFSGSVEADQLSVADDPKFSSAPFLQAKSLRVGVELLPLILSKQVNVTKVVVEDPQVNLLRNREGVWNFSSLGGASAHGKPADKASSTANVNVSRLELKDGTVTVTSLAGKRQPISYDKVNVAISNFSYTGAFPLVASARLPGGGSLKIDGTAGPINQADTALTPVQARVSLGNVDLAQSALVDPTLGITGSADFDGALSSDGRMAKASGTVKATSLKLAPKGTAAAVPVQLVFEIHHDLKTETGKVIQGDIAIGKAFAKLTGTYDMHGETTTIHTKLNGQAMAVDDLEGVLPAVGVVLPSGSRLKGGTLAVELESSGPLDRLTSTGWLKISNSSLDGFNLSSKLSALASLGGIQTGNDMRIETLSSDVANSPEGTRLDKMNLVIPSLGTVTGAGTVSPDGKLDFKMMANLSGGVGGGLTKVAGIGSNGIPVSVGGTTSNPTFAPDMKNMVGNQLKGLLKDGKAAGWADWAV